MKQSNRSICLDEECSDEKVLSTNMALMRCHPCHILRNIISIIQSDIYSCISYLYSEISHVCFHTRHQDQTSCGYQALLQELFPWFNVQGENWSNREHGRLLSRR
jgi:hypothetical protein